MAKLLLIDTETSGLFPFKHAPDQVAGFIVIDGKIKEKFNIEFQLHPQAESDPSAYKARGINQQDIVNRNLTSDDAKEQFCKMLEKYVSKFDKSDKFIPIGYNLKFDLDMLERWFKLAGDKFFGSYVFRPGVDVLSLALDYLLDERHKMVDFKQGTVAQYLGIEVDESKLHDALYDIEIMAAIYKKVRVHTPVQPS